jgi:hypothetical protein
MDRVRYFRPVSVVMISGGSFLLGGWLCTLVGYSVPVSTKLLGLLASVLLISAGFFFRQEGRREDSP